MKYEQNIKSKKITGLQTQARKPSTTISKMSTGGILWHVYKRHESLILNVITASVLTWAVVTQLG
jgi:hypothetical protein